MPYVSSIRVCSMPSCRCFYHLRRLRSICLQLGRDVTARLVSLFVLSRLNYCNVVLAGLPTSTLVPLQRVLHAAACLVLDLWPRDHVSQALRLLYWLSIEKEDRLQVLPVGPQVVDRAGVDVHRWHVNTCLQRPVTEHSALSHQRRLHHVYGCSKILYNYCAVSVVLL